MHRLSGQAILERLWRHKLILIGAVATAILVVNALRTNGWFPCPWSDESMYADAAICYLDKGFFGSTLQEGFAPGLERAYYYFQPGYPALMIAAFRIGGVSLGTMRTMSLLAGVIVLWTVIACARRIEPDGWVAAPAAVTLAIDPSLLRAANIGRPDIWALALALLAAWCYLRYLEAGRFVWAVPAGAFGALATTFHLLGSFVIVAVLAHLLLRQKRSAFVRPGLYSLLGGLALGFLPWVLYVLRDPGLFWAQFSIQFVAKHTLIAGMPWLKTAWHALDWVIPRNLACLAMAIFGIALAGYAVWVFVKKRWDAESFWLLLTVGAMAGAITGREMWYSIYFVAPLHLLVWLALARLMSVHRFLWIAGGALGVGFLLVTNAELKAGLNTYRYRGTSAPVSARVEPMLPDRARVMLLCLPDIYFDLRASPKRFALSQFVPPRIPTAPSYAEALDKVEFYVLSDNAPWQGSVYEPRVRSERRIEWEFRVDGRRFWIIDVRSEELRKERLFAPDRFTHRSYPDPVWPLRKESCRAEITLKSAAPETRRGVPAWYELGITNLGQETFRCRALAGSEDNVVNLAYHWLDNAGATILLDGLRTGLPADLAPGEGVTVKANVEPPARSGPFILEFDLVQEHVWWFKSVGSTTLRIPVTVEEDRPHAGSPVPPVGK